MTNMLTLIYGLGAAVTWGLSNVLIKSQVNKLPVIQLLTVRAIVGACTSFGIYFIFASETGFTLIEPLIILGAAGAVLTGYFGADILFVRALQDMPLSRVFPIQTSYPLIAASLAWIVFGDIISIQMIIGAVLVVIGVSLIGSEEPNQAKPLHRSHQNRGIGLSLLSALGWGISAIFLRWILENHDPITINVFIGLITALTFVMVSRPTTTITFLKKDPRIIGVLCIAGILGGTGISNLLFILAIHVAGVTQATVLACTAPLFTLIFAILILGEKITLKLTLGTIFTVLGIGTLVGG
jgi:drug/metabolite transporter (DMT)-like permease